MRTRLLALAALALTASVAPLPADASQAPERGDRRVCAVAPAGVAACHAHVRTKGAEPDATTSWQGGYSPAQLQTAYGVAGLKSGTLVAVIDAYAHPSAAADLKVYRDTFGLGTASLTQVNQNGGSKLPRGDVGWAQEEMLDLEMVSAVCPSCPILYVGANSASFADLGAAVAQAEKLKATIVSNSYGAAEFSGELSYAGSYDTPGVVYTVSSGDSGYGAQVPAAFNTVVAVGGTNLKLNADGSRVEETVWSGAGSGCSAYVSQPTWQAGLTSCTKRVVSDVSAVADPATGVAVYDSYGSRRGQNWYVFGGTSVAAPVIAGVYGLKASTSTASSLYNALGTSVLNDVTVGSNGSCGGTNLCTGAVKYDGPTGVGTPNGLGAF